MTTITVILISCTLGPLCWWLLFGSSRGQGAAVKGCGQCGYAIGGWSSPTCPECGEDVVRCGVRTGVRRARWAWPVLVLVTAPIVAFVVAAPVGELTGTTTVRGGYGFGVEPEPGVEVYVNVGGDEFTRRFPASRRTFSFVVLMCLRGGGADAATNLGIDLAAPPGHEVLAIDLAAPPGDEVLARAWRDVLGDAADEAMVAELTTVVATALRETSAAVDSNRGIPPFPPPSVSALPQSRDGKSPYYQTISTSSHGTAGKVMFVIVLIAWIIGGMLLCRRLGRPITRPPLENEWATG